MYALSNQKLYSIRFDLGDSEGNKRHSVYETWIEEENCNYTLHIDKYKGDAGDSFSYHNGGKFSTKDRDNDESSKSCAQILPGGWWTRDALIQTLMETIFQANSKRKQKSKVYIGGLGRVIWSL